jgi:hypothetical protein
VRTRSNVLLVLQEEIRKLLDILNGAPMADDHEGLWQHQLVMMADLNATELLPELVQVCQSVRKGMEVFASKVILVIETGDWRDIQGNDSVAQFLRLYCIPGMITHYDKTVVATVIGGLERDVLGTISIILRQEQFQPLLVSDIESAYMAKLTEANEGRVSFENFGQPRNHWEREDPIYPGLMASKAAVYHLDATPENRQRIIHYAIDFLNQVPESGRRCAEGMDTQPTNW